MQFRVDEVLFDKFPDLVIGVVVAKDIDNCQGGHRTIPFLHEQVEIVRNIWSHDRLESDPRINSWREAYRSFKAKPKKYRCSVENMVRMILNGLEFPSINKAVDIYNAISLKYCIPVGGDDLDKVVGHILLTYAKGDERFIPLNGTDSIPPKPGEVIYRDAEDVLCRRWNWRECDKSKMTVDSKNLCFVVEGLPPVSLEEVKKLSTELVKEIVKFCGGSSVVHMVDRHTPAVEI